MLLSFSDRLHVFLNYKILDNEVSQLLWFTGIMLVGIFLGRPLAKLIEKSVYRLIKRFSSHMTPETFLELMIRPLEVFIKLVFVFAAFSVLSYPAHLDLPASVHAGILKGIEILYETAFIISVTWIFLRLADYYGIAAMKRAEKTETKTDDQIVPFLKEIVKIIIFIIAVFIALGVVFHVNIAALITGLGIGGIAIAFAAKESIENFIASISIFLDKPFQVDDYVKIDDIEGVVEKVGFRSTRIRTLDKTFLTLPNKMLTDRPLDNFSLRTTRRVRFRIGVTYETPIPVILNISEQIKAYLQNRDDTNEENEVRLFEFADSSINIYVDYFLTNPDWGKYLISREEINTKISEIIVKNGSSMAYPTRTLYLKKEPAGAEITS